jgi:AbrB family looped-hinge helix DNA binding protein
VFRRIFKGFDRVLELAYQEKVAQIFFVWHTLFFMALIYAMTIDSSEVQLGAQGRLVIPAKLRRAMHLAAGDRLVMRIEGDSLILERREAVIRRLQGLFNHVPAAVNLVDELAEARRADASREASEA